jgi:hypothetical protein
MTNLTNLTEGLETFVEHERQETEVLAELNAALETHRKALEELAMLCARRVKISLVCRRTNERPAFKL